MEHIVLYDNRCALCNSVTKFLLRFDHKKNLVFRALDTQEGVDILASLCSVPDSIILLKEGKVYWESDAVFELLRIIGAPYSWLCIGEIFPKAWRDKIYRFVASNRYFLFGKYKACSDKE